MIREFGASFSAPRELGWLERPDPEFFETQGFQGESGDFEDRSSGVA